MALLPAQTSRKLKLFSASRPNYADYNGPSNGDYVRYVDGLMAWAEQEQERQRLKALGEKNRPSAVAVADSQWGRAPSKPVAAASVAVNTYAQPGSIDSAADRLKRQAKAQVEKLHQQAFKTSKPAPAGAVAGQPPPKAQKKVAAQSSWVLFVGVLIAVSIFATDWLPAVIIAWVVWNVFRTVRAASRTGKS